MIKRGWQLLDRGVWLEPYMKTHGIKYHQSLPEITLSSLFYYEIPRLIDSKMRYELFSGNESHFCTIHNEEDLVVAASEPCSSADSAVYQALKELYNI